jgi:KaiC/GvpD/RAD55 family RecA-like ATPase
MSKPTEIPAREFVRRYYVNIPKMRDYAALMTEAECEIERARIISFREKLMGIPELPEQQRRACFRC